MEEKKFYGLTEQQVQESRKLHGNNELAKRKKISFIEMFLANFKSFIVCFLAFALVVKTVLFFAMNRGKLLDIIILGVAFILATMISTILNAKLIGTIIADNTDKNTNIQNLIPEIQKIVKLL